MDQRQLRALVARMQEHVAPAPRPTANDDEIVRAATLCGYCTRKSTDGDHHV
jgi:hypothetical protein